MKKIIIIGGGPAGIMAAGIAAQRGQEVILYEKNNCLGKKLSITGKGRCNLTNATEPDVHMLNIYSNPDFLYSALYSFDSYALMDFFESLDVPLKIERGRRVFPVSEKASDLTNALKKFMIKNKVRYFLGKEVKELKFSNKKVIAVKIDNRWENADAVIIATGGLSYPATGSTGDGYKFARSAGHHVTKLFPSLVSLRAKENWIADLAGLNLKNISIILWDKKFLYRDFGELLFTHTGVSGPVILSASRFLPNHGRAILKIDLKPGLTENELNKRVLRDFTNQKNKKFINSLDELLPQKIIPVIVSLSGISSEKRVNEITKEERTILISIIKNLEITIVGSGGFNEAVITRGGIFVDEIDPSTMRSKLFTNLYFAGEILDVDALTGGYNLQIAFSTGYLAGTHC